MPFVKQNEVSSKIMIWIQNYENGESKDRKRKMKVLTQMKSLVKKKNSFYLKLLLKLLL